MLNGDKIIATNVATLKESRLFAQLALVSLTFFMLFYETIAKLLKDWSQNPNYSHGFLVPLIAAFGIWKMRKELRLLPLRPANWGILIIFVGLTCHIMGNIGAELFTMRLAMLITIYGLSVYLLGWSITQKISIPVVYLILMIPIPAIIWNQLAFPLQLFAATLSAHVVDALGIPVLREGNILQLEQTALEVVDACSGLRSLMSLLALGGAFAFFVSLRRINKLILFLLSVPIAVIANVVRLSATALCVQAFGPRATEGLMHGISGLLVFLVALIFLYSSFVVMAKLEGLKNDTA